MPLIQPKKCNLRAVAQACGCSVATVSMALRNMGRVPIATRERITKKAAELGYVRDLEMSRLMSRARRPEQLTTREELVFLSEAPIGRTPNSKTPWLHGMFHAAKEAAHLLGYELKPLTIDRDFAAQKKLSRALWTQGIRGLLIGPVTTWSPAILALDWKHFACVELGSTLQNPSLHRVERGFYDDLLELYGYLRDLGYRRIGIALPKMRLEFMRHMPESTLLFFERNHLDMQPVLPMHLSHEWSARGLNRWLRDQKPDVLLVYEPQIPRWLAKTKTRVPRDIGVVYLSSQGGKKSGLLPDIGLMAKEAIHLLARMVEGGEWGIPRRPRSHRFRNIFCPGGTIAIHDHAQEKEN